MQTLSLITYNMHKGFGVGKLRFLLPQMRCALTQLNPDFIFLQEVQGIHRRRAKRIQNWPSVTQFEYLSKPDWPYYLYAKNAVYGSGHHGNAILSKYPFEIYKNINLSKHHRASRSILYGSVVINHQKLHLLCIHFGLFKSERLSQYQSLIQTINTIIPADEPLIMAGDFNDWRCDLSESLASEWDIHEAFYCLEGKHARSFPCFKTSATSRQNLLSRFSS